MPPKGNNVKRTNIVSAYLHKRNETHVPKVYMKHHSLYKDGHPPMVTGLRILVHITEATHTMATTHITASKHWITYAG